MTELYSEWLRKLGEPYVPGAGREPPRAAFDTIATTIPVRVDAEALQASPALDLARQLYGARYFWEAGAVLDLLTAAALPDGRPWALLCGLKQLTLACLKMRLGQPNAAMRALRDAEKHLAVGRGLDLAIDVDALLAQCQPFRAAILSGVIGEALAERPSLATWTAGMQT